MHGALYTDFNDFFHEVGEPDVPVPFATMSIKTNNKEVFLHVESILLLD